MKSDMFESRVGEGDLEWFKRRFNISSDYTLSVNDKKAHELYTSFEKLVVYKDQMEGKIPLRSVCEIIFE